MRRQPHSLGSAQMVSELRREAYGPHGDQTRHRTRADLDAGLAALRAPPADLGTVTLLVVRHPDGARDTPRDIELHQELGMPGDGWARRPPRDPEAQLAVMCHGIAVLIANGEPLTVFGDNLFVDFDLSAANLPTGTRLRVGDAEVVVTPKPHNGCSKFTERFGIDALHFVQDPLTRAQNRRGIYWRVTLSGRVRTGDSVAVLERARLILQ